LNCNIDLHENLKKYQTKKNTEKLFDFLVSLEKWMEANLDVDKILDLINENGIQSLKEIHLKILKNS
jgi:hypothetical protein